MSRSTLTNSDVRRIKSRLWHGAMTSTLAEDYEVSSVSIRAIVAGLRWSEVEWPDESTGALSEARKKQINEARKGAGRYAVEKAIAKRLSERK